MEAVVGSPNKIKIIASDIVEPREFRSSVMQSRAMIVAMSRRIAIKLYNEIVKLSPEWYSKDDYNGIIKVIMTGSVDARSFFLSFMIYFNFLLFNFPLGS
jgi:type I restriction enzyme R subunit